MADNNGNCDKYPAILLFLAGMAFAIPSAVITASTYRLKEMIVSVKWLADFGKITTVALKILSVANITAAFVTIIAILLFLISSFIFIRKIIQKGRFGM